MPAPRDNFRPFITSASTVRKVSTCIALFNALDVRDLACYGRSTPPLEGFIESMKKHSGREFRILRRGDDVLIEDGDGLPSGPPLVGEGTDGVWALIEWGLARWDDGGMLQLVEHPSDNRLNISPARRVPDESRPGLRVDFDWGSNDNDF